MKEWFFSTAFSCWGEEERAAIDRVVSSGRFTQGEEVAALEREFSAFHGRKHGIMVNSGSSANLIVVAALAHRGHFRRGDKVLVPAIAWSTTYAPLIQYGLEPMVVDVDDTWNADPQKIRHDPRLKVIVGCSVLGNPADLATWESAAGVLEAVMIEDNCESLGAVALGGRRCGTFGLASTFSFFWSHQISAIEGGMILTDDPEFAELCRMYRAHGWTRDLVDKSQCAPGFDYEYDFQAFGYNVRGLELHAAIARAQLLKLPAMIEARLLNTDRFSRLLLNSGLPILLPSYMGARASPFGLQFCLDAPWDRARLVAALRAAGIDCRLPTGGSFLQHAYGARWREEQETLEADAIHLGGMFLGNAPFDIGEKIETAVAVMRETLR